MSGDLEVRDLHAHYGTAHVLFGVDLTVPAGTTTALLGRNGAGKTTLLKSIANAEVRTSGSVRYGSTDLRALSPYRVARAGVQLVPEDRRIFTRLTVRENLRLATKAATPERPPVPVDRIVELFPLLGDLIGRAGYALSGGEQQLLAIARAMVGNPSLLLLDEPSEGLAPRIVEQVGDAIERLQSEFSLTVVLAEQNSRFAVDLADAVCVIDGGRVVFDGSAGEFATQDAVRERYLQV
ncbi:MAG: ABC transporter ATP-binding protein [Actinomycetota bacterium]|nr:ABC transporter ATP-binding protein [Actinomycetota bacterium]